MPTLPQNDLSDFGHLIGYSNCEVRLYDSEIKKSFIIDIMAAHASGYNSLILQKIFTAVMQASSTVAGQLGGG